MRKKLKTFGAMISAILCFQPNVHAYDNYINIDTVNNYIDAVNEHSTVISAGMLGTMYWLSRMCRSKSIKSPSYVAKPNIGDGSPRFQTSEIKRFSDLRQFAEKLWINQGYSIVPESSNKATVVLTKDGKKYNRTYFCPDGGILSPFYALDARYVQQLSSAAKQNLLDGGLPPSDAQIVDIKPLILESLGPVLQNLVDFANETLENDIKTASLTENTKLSFADLLSLFQRVMGQKNNEEKHLTSLDLITKLFLGHGVKKVVNGKEELIVPLFTDGVNGWLVPACTLFSFLSPGMFLLNDDQMSIKRLITKGVNIPIPVNGGYKNIVPFDFLTTFPIVGVHTGSTHNNFKGEGCLQNYNSYSGPSVTDDSQNVVIMPSNGCISPARDKFDNNGTLPIILSRIDGNTVCAPFGLNNKTSGWVTGVIQNDLHLAAVDDIVQNCVKELTMKLTYNSELNKVEMTKRGTNLPDTLRDVLEKYVDSFLKKADALCETITSTLKILKTVTNSDLSSKLDDLLTVLRKKRLIDNNITFDPISLNKYLTSLAKLQPLFERKVDDSDIQEIVDKMKLSTTHINSDSENRVDDRTFYEEEIKAFEKFEKLSESGKKAKYLASLFEKNKNPNPESFLCMARVPNTPEDAEKLINEGMELMGQEKNEDADNKFKEAIDIMEKALKEQGIPWGNAEIDHTCLIGATEGEKKKDDEVDEEKSSGFSFLGGLFG